MRRSPFFDQTLYTGCGTGLLRGREWARFTFVGAWAVVLLASSLKSFDAVDLGRLLLLGIWVYVLFRPGVSEYMATVQSMNDPALGAWPAKRHS